MEIARFIIGVILLVVAAVLATQLWKGNLLFLIAKPEQKKNKLYFPAGTSKTAQRAAWMMVAAATVIALLLAYGMSVLSGSASFTQVITFLSNASLIAFCLSVLWALLGQRDVQTYEDRFKTGGVRLILFTIVTCVVLTLLSLLFS